MTAFPAPIWRQITTDAPYAWHIREGIAESPVHRAADLAVADAKLNAFLDALRIGLVSGLSIDDSVLAFEDPGSVFITATLGFTLGRDDLLDRACEALAERGDYPGEFHAAVSWLGLRSEQVSRLVDHANGEVRQAAVATFASAPDEHWFADTDPAVHVRMLDWIGHRRSHAHGHVVRRAYAQEPSDGDEAAQRLRFAALRAGVLLGDNDAYVALSSELSNEDPNLLQTVELLVRFGAPTYRSMLLDTLSSDDFSPRVRAHAYGASGLPAHVPQLLALMEDPEYARVAGQAFCTITGADITADDLDASVEPDWEDTVNVGGDPQYSDVEELLAMPHTESVVAWWASRAPDVEPQERYLVGGRLTPEHLSAVLASGTQTQRKSAAYEMAALDRDAPVPKL
ncbi:MAG: hypothetical protein AAGA68_02495 [Pseudomonadota bacterium]